jgi:hypothetical protein
VKKYFTKIFNIPWYFAAFAAYPVLALLSYNINEIKYTPGICPLLVSAAAAVVLFLFFRLVYRDGHRAAFAVTALALLFYSYVHIYDLVFMKWKITHLTAWMLGLWLVFAILGLVLAALRKIRFEKAALTLNVISLGLVLVSAVQVIWWSVPQARVPGAQHAPVEVLHVPPGQTPPDIYYIILDSYGSAGLLKQAYGYDNSAFVQHLEALGFYVAGCSQSNYMRTELSLGSSLNMDYLPGLDPAFTPDNIDQGQLWNAIRSSAVRLDLEQAGYKTVAFATGYAWSELDDADVYFGLPPLTSGMTSFETLLVRTTPTRHLEDLGVLNLDQIDGQRYRQRTQLIFNSMDKLAHIPGPKFVFIHVLPPHPPFVFGPDGTPTDPATFLNEARLYTSQKYAEGYQNQVTYINQQVEKAVATLIAGSSTPPIIILQGDHGPWLQSGSNQFRILNAYYLPGHADRLYPTVSPVNTFRIVLETYLGADYKLLDDASFYSPIPQIYDFSPVPNPCSDR